MVFSILSRSPPRPLLRRGTPPHRLSPASISLPFFSTMASSNPNTSQTTKTNSNTTNTSGSCTKTNLEIIGNGSAAAFISSLDGLCKPYTPFPFVGWNCHVETIFAHYFRSRPEVTFRRECLRTPDDGAVALDWVVGDDKRSPPDSPVLVLLPGLTGGSGDAYIRHMLVRARKRGWRVVVFNSRGCGDSPVTTPQFYSASYTEDLRQVVNHVMTCYPKANVYAIGWSLGANILVNYLAQESETCALSGAVSLCNPFNLVYADEDFRKGFNNVYDKSLARALRRILKKHALLFEGLDGEYKIPVAANAQSIREFDEALTRVSFGFKSVDEYYSKSSSSKSIKYVRTPLLCIQACNDPFAPNRGIPRKEIEENPFCVLIVTPQGGHLGWVAGTDAPFGAPWTDSVIMEFLANIENENAKSFKKTNISRDNTSEQSFAPSLAGMQ